MIDYQVSVYNLLFIQNHDRKDFTPNFEESEIYKKAYSEFQTESYGRILNPLHSIVVEDSQYMDCWLRCSNVYLFYPTEFIYDILSTMEEIFNKQKKHEKEKHLNLSLHY